MSFSLSQIKVMLRDIRESWKLARHAATSLPFPFSPRIISFVYWPEINAQHNSLPIVPVLKDALDQYTATFSQHKPARSITWYTEHGSQVELELALEGRTVEVQAPLIQAQILILFTEKGHFWDIFTEEMLGIGVQWRAYV